MEYAMYSWTAAFVVLALFFLIKLGDLVDAILALGKSNNSAKFVAMTEEGGISKVYEVLGEYKGQYVLKERPDLRTTYVSKVQPLN